MNHFFPKYDNFKIIWAGNIFLVCLCRGKWMRLIDGRNILKTLNYRLVNHQEKCCLLSDFQYSFRSSWSTGNFLAAVSDRIAGTLIYPRLLTGFGMLIFFRNVSLIEFQVRYLALFHLFSVIDSFKLFWIESLHKNTQLMLKFLKAPFLVQHFTYYTLMTFLMMLSVIVLSLLMILLSTKCDQASGL